MKNGKRRAGEARHTDLLVLRSGEVIGAFAPLRSLKRKILSFYPLSLLGDFTTVKCFLH